VGADGSAPGVAEVSFDIPPTPAEFTAATLKKYAVPLVKPVLRNVVVVTFVAIGEAA